jgi:hypothetical protein
MEIPLLCYSCNEVFLTEGGDAISDCPGEPLGLCWPWLPSKRRTEVADILMCIKYVTFIFAEIKKNVRLEVFTAVTMNNGVFWDVMPCGSCKNRRFRGT